MDQTWEGRFSVGRGFGGGVRVTAGMLIWLLGPPLLSSETLGKFFSSLCISVSLSVISFRESSLDLAELLGLVKSRYSVNDSNSF